MKRKQEQQQLQNNGLRWIRGATIGQGSFGTVSLATNTRPNTRQNHLPPTMAVKWAELIESSSLEKETEILSDLEGCPHILRCYGGEITNSEKGQKFFNLLLEYGSGGSLGDHIRSSSNGLAECKIRGYTRSILQGLIHIHERGYVHCDIKPDNIILVQIGDFDSKFDAKIGDFGLARKVEKNKKRTEAPCLRGTALYMSPESIKYYEQEPCMDIWALGCVVTEMATGKPPWNWEPDSDVTDLLDEIANSDKIPKIPSGLSEKGKDFLNKCFDRTTWRRWTAEKLLHHPFVAEDDDEGVQESEGVLTLRTRTRVAENPSPSSLLYLYNHIMEMSCYSWSKVVGSSVKEEREGAQKRRRTATDDHITWQHLSGRKSGAESQSTSIPPGFEHCIFRNRRSR